MTSQLDCDAVVDALNRATSVGGVACGSDVLGNRTSTGSRSLGWDCLNRLTFVTDPSPTTGYALVGQYGYRADGMRTLKYTPNALSVYRYDGQMGMEDEEWSTDHLVTRYGLGARGVDMIERTSSSGTVTAFPIYDAHGNNVASLTRDGSGGYGLSDRRSYDAWGAVRSQQSGGDPKLRYCGSLGHKADDETGLVYMRARYYEPTSGRFVSEDPGRQGVNWFAYANAQPTNKADPSGRGVADFAYLWTIVIGLSAKIMENPSWGTIADLRTLIRMIDAQAKESNEDDMEAFDLSATSEEIDPDLADYEASRTFENLETNKLEQLALKANAEWLIELGEDALDQAGMG